MKDYYDFSKGFKNTERAERLRENGYKVTVTDGDCEDARVVREYIVTPEEVQARDKRRKNHRIQHLHAFE
ncbi:MAG: hypothetical protein FWD23_05020 [Oscillospiraceae bacterium]|nr:hypothetical protein [Oscillospiraceae bacterium]